jgi:hypothetical protein
MSPSMPKVLTFPCGCRVGLAADSIGWTSVLWCDLHAAAPELLAFAEWVANDELQAGDVRTEARAAIAKARGEA